MNAALAILLLTWGRLVGLVHGDAPLPYGVPHAVQFQGVGLSAAAGRPVAPPEMAVGEGATLALEPSAEGGWALVLTGPAGAARREVWSLSGREGAPWVMPTVLLADFAPREQGGSLAIALLFRINEGNPRYDYTWSYLVTCAIDRGQAAPCQRRKVARTNLANVFQESTWVYAPTDPEGPGPEPGRKSDVRLLTFDLDQDGFRDLVIWRRQCRSMTRAEWESRPLGAILPDQCDLDLRIEREEVLWMRYDPAMKQFEEPRSDDRLWLPDRLWWRKLPGLNAIAFW